MAAAAVFTDNKMTAAPVLTSDAHLARTGGRAAAVILNSGNANAATGAQGKTDAHAMCQAAADELGCDAHEVLGRRRAQPRWELGVGNWELGVGS